MMEPYQTTGIDRKGGDLGELLVGSLTDRWRRYRRQLKRTRREYSEEAVHDLRVATRRLMSLLDMLVVVLQEDRLRRIRRDLKKRLDLFDPLRDAQVQLLAVEKMLVSFPELGEFHEMLANRERSLVRKIGKKLKTSTAATFKKPMLQTRKQLESLWAHPSQSDTAFVTVMNSVDDAFARVMSRRNEIDPSDSSTIHRTRVAFKKFRYMVEVLQPLLADMTSDRLKQMHGFQTMMGDIQDVEVLIGTLNAFCRQEKPDSDLFLFPARQALANQRAFLIERFLGSVAELSSFWNHDHLRLTIGPLSHKQVI